MVIQLQNDLRYKNEIMDGLYWRDKELIQINKDLNLLGQFSTLIHELLHYFINTLFTDGKKDTKMANFLHKLLDTIDINF